jgi:septal ring-binding cell division protein DamX
MRQLKERITHAFNLLPLPPRDIHDYISFRLRAAGYHGPDLFGPEALRIISDASEGLTRRINIYADKTLLAAFAAGTHTVSPDHARAAVSDTQIVVAPKTTSRSVAVAAAAGLACGIAIGYAGALFLNPAPEIPAPAAAAPSRAPVQAIATSPAPVAPPPAEAAAAASPAVQPPAGASGLVTPAASPPPAAPASSAPVEAPATKGPKGLESRFTAGLALLEGASGGRYVVQLMMTDARDPAYLQAYLAEASRTLRPEELYLYPSGSADSPKVGVLYGAFQTRKEASDAMDALPGNLRQFRPYVRAVEAVRNDVRRVPAA